MAWLPAYNTDPNQLITDEETLMTMDFYALGSHFAQLVQTKNFRYIGMTETAADSGILLLAAQNPSWSLTKVNENNGGGYTIRCSYQIVGAWVLIP